jgi:hypothetical protein
MAKPDLTNMLTKREILYSEKYTDEDRNAAADEFIGMERFGEALEFLEVTRDAGRLARIRDAALERGDTFLLLRVEKLGGEELPAETWRRAAEKAETLGKYFDVYRALTRVGDEEKAEAIREKHMPGFQPFKPEGK